MESLELVQSQLLQGTNFMMQTAKVQTCSQGRDFVKSLKDTDWESIVK